MYVTSYTVVLLYLFVFPVLCAGVSGRELVRQASQQSTQDSVYSQLGTPCGRGHVDPGTSQLPLSTGLLLIMHKYYTLRLNCINML